MYTVTTRSLPDGVLAHTTSGLSEAHDQARWPTRVIWIVLKKLAFSKSTPQVRYRYTVSLPLLLGMTAKFEIIPLRCRLYPG